MNNIEKLTLKAFFKLVATGMVIIMRQLLFSDPGSPYLQEAEKWRIDTSNFIKQLDENW